VLAGSTSLAIGDQPLFTGVYDRQEFTEKIRFPRVNGRIGEAILFERKYVIPCFSEASHEYISEMLFETLQNTDNADGEYNRIVENF